MGLYSPSSSVPSSYKVLAMTRRNLSPATRGVSAGPGRAGLGWGVNPSPPARPSPAPPPTQVHGVDLDVDVQDQVHLEGLALAVQAGHCGQSGGQGPGGRGLG